MTSWKNRRDGETVEGVVITPRALEDGKKYPLSLWSTEVRRKSISLCRVTIASIP